MRVLHVIDSGGIYGAEAVVLNLVQDLAALGHPQVLVSVGDTGDGEKDVEREAIKRGGDVCPLRITRGPNPLGALKLLRAVRGLAPDIVHLHGYRPDVLLGLLPRSLRPAPMVSTVHGYTGLGGLNRMTLYTWADRVALRRMDGVALVQEQLAERTGIERTDPRCRVIGNGIRPSTASERERESGRNREIVSFCGVRPVVGSLGRLSPEKGFDVLLHALGKLRGAGSGARAVLMGEGGERRHLERIIRETGLDGHVLMPGFVANAREYLDLFDVFVLPSRTEGVPMAILEAMEARVPVVATRVGGVPVVLDGGKAGVLVDPGDPDALAEALQRVISDRSLAEHLVAHAAKRVELEYSSRRMAEQYLAFYRELSRVA